MPTDPRPGFRLTPQAVFGLVIITVGLLLTADNLKWFESEKILRFWPIGVIVAGSLMLAQSDASSGRLVGGLIVIIGMLLAAEHTFGWPIDASDWWMPVALIFVGLVVMVRAFEPPKPKSDVARKGGPAAAAGASTQPPMLPSFSPEHAVSSSDAKISEFAIWAGKQRRNASSAFRHADLTAIMGGIELDLRSAATANGEAVIDLFVMWGGIEIWVPPDWVVSNEVGVLMAGAEDKSTGTQGARHRLVVRGFAIMGGVEIKT